MRGEQIEIDALWIALEDGLKDQFIDDATEYGLSRWETILGITPKGTDTLDDRRFRILTRINEDLPYTYQSLNQRLSNICGNNGYTITLNANTYTLNVKINLINKNNFSDIESMLDRVTPANLIVSLELLYNTHSTLAPYTHAQLAAYTHHQLRNEVLKNGE